MNIDRRQLALSALAFGLLSVVPLSVAPAMAGSADEEAVAEKLEAFRAAQVAADAKAFDALCATELSYSHSDGRVEDGHGGPVPQAHEQAPAVPVETVIWDGAQAIVWVESGPMQFERRKVKVALEQDGRWQVREGLKPGELVVARGAIFIDNEWRQ